MPSCCLVYRGNYPYNIIHGSKQSHTLWCSPSQARFCLSLHIDGEAWGRLKLTHLWPCCSSSEDKKLCGIMERKSEEQSLPWCRPMKIKQWATDDLHWSLHDCSPVISVTCMYQHICLFRFLNHSSSCRSQMLLASWQLCFTSNFLGPSKEHSPFCCSCWPLASARFSMFYHPLQKGASNYVPDVSLTLTTLKCDFVIFVEM